jgi:hypothetical protein
MVDRRPRMRRSHRNITILIFTCLIRRSDGSYVSNWTLAVGYLGFYYKQPPWPSPSRSECCLPPSGVGRNSCSARLPTPSSCSPRWGRTTVERVERSRDPHRVQEVSSLQLLSLYLPHCIKFPVRAVTDLIRFEGFRDLIWVGNQNKSCRSFQYLSREYLFTNLGWVF